MELFFIAVLLALALVNWKLAGSLLYPPAVFAIYWAVTIAGIALAGDFFNPVSSDTYSIYTLGAAMFSAGGFLYLLLEKRETRRIPLVDPNSRYVERFLDVGFILLLLIFPFFYGKLQSIFQASGMEDFWISVRWQSTYGVDEESSLGLFSYVPALGTFLSLAAFYESDRGWIRRTRSFGMVAITFAFHIMTVARLGAFMLIFALSFIAFIKPGVKNVRVVVTLLLIFVVVFTVPALLLNKGGSVEEGVTENVASLGESFLTMALGGPVAFDQVVRDPEMISERWLSFRFFIAFANAFGATDAEVPAVVLEETYVPSETNVYTFYVSYLRDLGITGVSLILFALGALTSFIYSKAARGIRPAIIFYGLLMSGLMVSNASDAFLTAISFWVLAATFCFLLYYLPSLWAPAATAPGGISIAGHRAEGP